MNTGYVFGLIGTDLVGTSPSVVLNDTGTQATAGGAPSLPPPPTEGNRTADSKPTVQSVLAELETMECRRKTWEAGVHRQSNIALYELLGECLAWLQVDVTAAAQETRQKGLAEFLSTRGYDHRKGSPLATLVVRAVFGSLDPGRPPQLPPPVARSNSST